MDVDTVPILTPRGIDVIYVPDFLLRAAMSFHIPADYMKDIEAPRFTYDEQRWMMGRL